MPSTYLTRTQTAGNRRKGTFSAWVKRANLGYQYLISWNSTTSGTSLGDWIRFNGEALDILKYTGSLPYRVQTNRLFRDTSAWYHIVVAYDSEQATASNRIKIYVNGVQETSFGTSSYPSQNYDFEFNNNSIVACVGKNYNTEANFDGSMSHVHWCDGYAYSASDFGSTDATTGEWKINTSPSVSYGTNGFFILKDGNSVTDQSGQSNNFTANGTLTKTEDCPSNVFATFNPLHFQAGRALTMSNGNGKIASNQNNWQPIGSTLAVPPKTGKWYWEFSQFIEAQTFVGFISSECNININLPYQATDGMITYFYAGRLTNDGSETESYFTAISATTDVVGVALDMTAGTYGQVQFYLNGSPTGSAVALGSSFANQFVMPFAMCNGTGGRSVSINTGNGYFGSTQISSAGSNASGIGIFEYDVPTGYTALSTKGLNL